MTKMGKSNKAHKARKNLSVMDLSGNSKICNNSDKISKNKPLQNFRKQVISIENLITNPTEKDHSKNGIADVLINGTGKFSKMAAFADCQVLQGSIKCSSRLTSNKGGKIGASQMQNILGKDYDIKEFFLKTMSRSDIPLINSNWGTIWSKG